jgi:hypothetical protein
MKALSEFVSVIGEHEKLISQLIRLLCLLDFCVFTDTTVCPT